MPADRQAALDAWEADYRRVRELFAGLTTEQLDLPTANRGWTVRSLAARIAADGRYTIRNGGRVAWGKDVLPVPVPGELVFAVAKVINARTVRRNRRAGSSELIALLDAIHEEARRFVYGLPDEAWERERQDADDGATHARGCVGLYGLTQRGAHGDADRRTRHDGGRRPRHPSRGVPTGPGERGG
jgi:Mycothiol maleylpyruvate isomerase N-terminal domain